jgi:hypothetical protein
MAIFCSYTMKYRLQTGLIITAEDTNRKHSVYVPYEVVKWKHNLNSSQIFIPDNAALWSASHS